MISVTLHEDGAGSSRGQLVLWALVLVLDRCKLEQRISTVHVFFCSLVVNLQDAAGPNQHVGVEAGAELLGFILG